MEAMWERQRISRRLVQVPRASCGLPSRQHGRGRGDALDDGDNDRDSIPYVDCSLPAVCWAQK
jgi:hypothetical protein